MFIAQLHLGNEVCHSGGLRISSDTLETSYVHHNLLHTGVLVFRLHEKNDHHGRDLTRVFAWDFIRPSAKWGIASRACPSMHYRFSHHIG